MRSIPSSVGSVVNFRCRVDLERTRLRASSVDIKGLSSVKRNRRIVKMESHIPRGYLSGGVIPSQAVWPVGVIGGHYVVDFEAEPAKS